jgi:predicted PurR-regulated permease PerM
VKVPAGVTVVAVLLGAAWLGVVGALIAVPVAAVVQLLVQECFSRCSTRRDRDEKALITGRRHQRPLIKRPNAAR